MPSSNKRKKLEARGNKKGIDARFSINEEKLDYTTQEKYDEKDYPIIYRKRHPKTIAVLEDNTDALEMCKYHLPESL